jgi:hypothetical protein
MQALQFPLDRTSRPSWFAIVGAPRCGTTSLAHYLSAHREICFSSPKEPHFFSMNDLRELRPPDGADLIQSHYLNRFFPGRSDDTVLAEGSVSYLYAPERMLPILKIWPDARFIIAIRNPLEMLPSLHQRHLYNGDETVSDFARAWSLVDQRRAGKNIPRSCLDLRLLDYKEIGCLGKHLRRFFEVVGRERCFVSVFDDLVANPGNQLCDILEFLQLPVELPSQFAIHRPAKRVRIGWLQRALKRPPNRLTEFLVSEANLIRNGKSTDSAFRTSAIGRQAMRIRKRMLAWNRMNVTPQKLDERLRNEMCAWFEQDVGELGALLGRDLGHWLHS